MASVVDICNMSLSHLGDSATVASIDPPEGSAQAEHCARFYPQALSALLEMPPPWSFATRRIALAQVDNPSSTWRYAYAKPSDAVTMIAVISPDATDDYSSKVGAWGTSPSDAWGTYSPQEFSPETDSLGNSIILTNQENAVLRYTVRVDDTTKFSPLFVECLTWLLASKLAGPVLKGEAGMNAAQACTRNFLLWLGKAADSDASQRRAVPQQHVGWMTVR